MKHTWWTFAGPGSWTGCRGGEPEAVLVLPSFPGLGLPTKYLQWYAPSDLCGFKSRLMLIVQTIRTFSESVLKLHEAATSKDSFDSLI